MQVTPKKLRQELPILKRKLNWKNEYLNTKSVYSYVGLGNVREVINRLIELNLFKSITSSIKDSIIFTTRADDMKIEISESNLIESKLKLLDQLIDNLLQVILQVSPEESLDSVNIRLPEIKDFDELSKVSKEIHIALTQVILNKDIKGETKIMSVENGSIWLNVFVGSVAVSVIGSLAWSASVIYKKIQEGKLLAQQVKNLKVRNDSLEDILKAQKAETELMIQAEAEHVNSKHFKINEPENIERIKNSISTLANLIDKGAQIQPALYAPEEVSNLFPDPKKLDTIETKIEKLVEPN